MAHNLYKSVLTRIVKLLGLEKGNGNTLYNVHVLHVQSVHTIVQLEFGPVVHV